MPHLPQAPDPDVVAGFDLMISAVPGVVRKGATMPYVSVNGNMYAMINKANVIGLRLDKDDLSTFLQAYGAGPFEGVPGLISKEYANVPRALLGDVRSLHNWFRISHAYALRLKPQATKRG
jgi:hypothetical protein